MCINFLFDFYFYSGVHASYPLLDFEELICSNPLQIDYKKLKHFLQKCPVNYEVCIIPKKCIDLNRLLIKL